MSFIKVIGFFINAIFLVVMLGVAGLFLMPYLPIEQGFELRIVESGSMEPAIMTGSLIAVRPQVSYEPGEVIMFESRYADVPTTHRVLETYEENGRTWFVTQGDANEEADAAPISIDKVIGAVAFDVPRAGFVLDFARQPLGFAFLIVLPAALIVLGEAEKIWQEIRRRRSPHSGGSASQTSPTTPVTLTKPTTARRQVAKRPAARIVPPPVRRPTLMMDIATPVEQFQWPTLDLRGMTPYKPATRRLLSVNRITGALSVVVFSVLVWSAGYLGTTVSYFNDIETSIDNLFAAIALDVSATADGDLFNFVGGEIDDDDGAVVVFVAPEGDSVAVIYDVATEETGGPSPLCTAIVADSDAPVSYDGPLLGLSADDVTFDVPWSIQFSLPDESGLSLNELCTVDIVLTAWHYDVLTKEGYFDEERVPLSFTYTGFAPLTLENNFAPAAAFIQPESTEIPDPTDATEPTEENAKPTEPVEDEVPLESEILEIETAALDKDEPEETQEAANEVETESESDEPEPEPEPELEPEPEPEPKIPEPEEVPEMKETPEPTPVDVE